MSTDLRRIGEKARSDHRLVFTSLYHHVTDVDNLRACYEALPGDRAVGVDGVTKEQYGENLEENLQGLSQRLRRMGYKPQPKRRSYIPKPGSEKGRPLGISCFEDKLVELALKRVLEPIYEPIFEASSYGYRPGCSQHGCLDGLGRTIQQKRVSHVVEADIKSFFDKVNHEWMLKFLGQRIGDPRIIRLITRMLKGGILEEGLVKATEEGTPQGSILSPLLSNIYLHYVLDLWFSRVVGRGVGERRITFAFADDFVACFQYPDDARRFMENLSERLERFSLKLAMEKTRCLEFGRFARGTAHRRGEKPQEFTFPGLHALLREDQERTLQGQTPNQPQEARAQSARVLRLGAPRAAQAAQRRDAQTRQDARTRAPELLRHHGQRTVLFHLCLSRNAYSAQMAQPQEPAQGIHLGSVQPGARLGRLAGSAYPQRPEPVS